MSVFTPDQDAYQRAAEIANTLLMRGLPVLGFGALGGKLHMTFQLQDERASYTARVAEADATPEVFERFYELVA